MNSTRIIIPCRDAGNTIDRCLAAIFESQDLDFHVVLVDDGNNGDLNSLTHRYNVSIVPLLRGFSAGAARNAGATGYADGTLVFVDADVEVTRNAVARLIAPIIEGRAGATVGRYSDRVEGTTFVPAFKQLYLSYTYGSPQSLRNTFWTALGAVDARFFWEAGGFSEDFRGAGPEDVDLGIKLTKLGVRVEAVPEAEGRHLSSMNVFGLIKNDFRKGAEDIYVHCRSRVPLTDNRHAGPKGIAAVVISWTLPLIVLSPLRNRIVPLALLFIAYLSVRGGLFFSKYALMGKLFLLRAALLSYVLDIVRGMAVFAGIAFVGLEILTQGRWKPFGRSDG